MAEGAQQKKAGGKAGGKKGEKGPGSGDLGGEVGEKLRKLIEEHGEDELKMQAALKQLVPMWQGPMARLVLSKELSPEEAEKLWEAAHGPPVMSEPPKDPQVKAGPGAQAALAQADDLGAMLSSSLKQMTAAPEALMAPLHKAKPNVAAATMTRLHQQPFDGKRSSYQVLDEMTQGGARSLLAMGDAVRKDDQEDDDKGGGEKKLDFKSGPARAWASKIVAAMSQKGAVDSALEVAGNAPAWASMRLALRQEPSKLPQVVENLLDQVEKLLSDAGNKEIVPAELAARIKAVIGPVTARLHTGPEANQAAAEHGAKAVAVGEDVFFAEGQFKPGSPEGDFLIAHELAHVAQAQKKALDKAAPMAMTSGRVVDEAEVQADLQARLVVESGNYDVKVPAPPAPTGFAKDDGQRSAQLAAQQQRLALASGGGDGAPAAPAGAAGGGAGGAAPEAAAPAAAPEAAAPAASGGAGDDSSSTGAYTKVMSANPSSQPEDWEKAGDQASTNLKAEQEKAAEAVPTMTAQMEGTNANAKGADSGGGASADVNAKGEGADPTAKPPPPKEEPPPPKQSAGTDQKLASVGESKEQLKTQGQEVIQSLKTTDPNLKTDPGPSPVVELSGGSDPAATVSAEGQAKQQAGEELQKQRDKIVAGPGPAQVQPIKVEEQLKVTSGDMPVVTMPTLPPVEGMGQLKGWAQHTSNAAIKSSFDNLAKPKLDAAVAPAKDQLAQASTEKDQAQQKAIADAQSKAAEANADAQAKQAEAVSGARTQIANEQQSTLDKQKAAVADLESKATSKRAETIAKVDARVQADQANIQSQYQNAQKQADDAQTKAEADAKAKKDEAEAKSKEGSWWDQAVDAVTSAIKDVASAIDGILSAVRDAVGSIIDTVKNAACALIDAAKDFITSAISAFGDWLKDLVNATIGQLFPELAAALNAAIDAAVAAAKKAVEFIADNLKKAVTAFFDGLKASFNALIAAYQAAVQAAATFATALVTGDWSLVGKMLLEGVLKLAGIDPGAFYALVGEAKETIDLILDDPAGFAGHVVDAVKLGFSQFGGNFWTHLKAGLVQWLFGTMGEAGITMPATFDVAGIFDLACQVLGLTYPRLRQKAVKLIGEKNVARIEFIWKYVESLLTGGWAGLWEKIQQDLSSLWGTIIDGIKSYLIETVVKQAIMKVATMWNPAGAIIQLLITAWNVYCWVKENAQRIFGLIQAVVSSMSNIAHGNISGAANFIEQSLAKLMPIAISFLAHLLGLGGIADKIKEVIGKVQAAIDSALDKLIDGVLTLFQGKGTGPEQAGDDSVDTPRSLVVPNAVHLTQLSPAAATEAGGVTDDQVIHTGGAGSPVETTRAILSAHSDASYDKPSGVLTLPPLQPGPLQSAASLSALGAAIGQQTGVSKVTVRRQGDDKISFVLSVNPEGPGGDADAPKTEVITETGFGTLVSDPEKNTVTYNGGDPQQKVDQAIAETKKPENDNDIGKEAAEILGKIKDALDKLKTALQPPRPELRQLSRDTMSLMLNLKEKFKMTDLGSHLPQFDTPVVGNHPVGGKIEAPDGSSRESHHVPPKKLAELLGKDMVASAADLIADKRPEFKKVGTTLQQRGAAVAANEGGTGLTAILIHKVTHQNAEGTAAHSGTMKDEIEKQLGPMCEATQRERITIRNPAAKDLSVNPQEEQLAPFIQKCKEQAEAIPDPAKKQKSVEEIALVQSEEEKLNQKAEADAVTEALKTVRLTMSTAFQNSLDQGIAAVRAAVAASHVDGDRSQGATEVGKLAAHAAGTWKSIITIT